MSAPIIWNIQLMKIYDLKDYSPCCCPTCDPVRDAEESGRPLPCGKRLSVVTIAEAHPQQLLPHRFIPQSINERVAHGAAEREPRHQSLQLLRDVALTPQGLCTHHPNVRPPSYEKGADHHQDGDEGLALTPCVHKAPSAPVRGSWSAWVLASVSLSSRWVVLGYNNRPAVNFSGFHASHAENDSIAGQHDEEGREDAPGDPEGGVTRLSGPGCDTCPL